jgi:cytochrome c
MKRMVAIAAALTLFTVAHAEGPLPAGDAAKGATIFTQCSACHTVGPGAQKSVGPVLNGVIGRRSATSPGYRYSGPMRNAALVWDEPTLARYLRGPEQMVPGSKMVFPGLTSDQDIADVIAYLKQYGADGQPAKH